MTITPPELGHIGPVITSKIPGFQLVIGQASDGNFVKIETLDQPAISGVVFNSHWRSFDQLLRDASAETQGEKKQNNFIINDLGLPFLHLRPKTLGLGLTYPDHQQDVGLSKVVLFEKNAAPSRLNDTVAHRAHLDYEAEIALLLHRHEPKVFGFLLHNDLTDRRIQAINYDKKAPGRSFSLAKSFATANAYGTVMAIGGDSAWQELRVDLYWNEQRMQALAAKNHLLKPSEIHHLVFEKSQLSGGYEWVLIGTGTPGGTIFRAPNLREKLGLMFRSGLNPKKAVENWLNHFTFIQPADRLRFISNSLGHFQSEVI